MITDKLRAVTPAPDGDRMHHDYGDRGSPVDKRSRGEGPPPGAHYARSCQVAIAQVFAGSAACNSASCADLITSRLAVLHVRM